MKRQPVYGSACLFILSISLFPFSRKQAFFVEGEVKKLLFSVMKEVKADIVCRVVKRKRLTTRKVGRKATGLSPETSG